MKTTKDYSMFEFVAYNRRIDENRVDKIAESIKTHGYLLPMLVNQNMIIADGQHRLKAAEKVGSEVTYIVYEIEDDKLPILIGTVNSVSKNWSRVDYFNMWNNLEYENYCYISDLMNKHDLSFIHIAALLPLGGSLTDDSDKRLTSAVSFRNGGYTLTKSQRERLENHIKNLYEILDYNKSYFEDFKNYNAFVSVCIRLIKNRIYNHNKMLSQLEKFGGQIKQAPKTDDYLRMIEDVYNKKQKKRISFGR